MGNTDHLSVGIVIPFRDRGIDPCRAANLDCVLAHWANFGAPVYVAHDDRSGDAQFNRSRAYNNGWRMAEADVVVFTESDMLCDYGQIRAGIRKAHATPGLVVPFSEYWYLSEADSARVRAGEIEPARCEPETVHPDRHTIGPINIVSRATMSEIGQWDECFDGNWYDDNAMERAFDVCCGPTDFITGRAYHLWHLPGWAGDHRTAADRAATVRNRMRLRLYQRATTPWRIRQLTMGSRR